MKSEEFITCYNLNKPIEFQSVVCYLLNADQQSFVKYITLSITQEIKG